MKRVAMLIVAVLMVASVAEASKRPKKNSDDPSTNFSKSFDDDVKYERDHPKPADDGAAPASTDAPKRKSSSHRRTTHTKSTSSTSDSATTPTQL